MPLFGNDRPLSGQGWGLAGQNEPLANQDDALFGQDRELKELYDALFEAQNEELQQMRSESEMGGAIGQVNNDLIAKIMGAITPERKQLTPERIHNLGVLYGKPISQEQLNYFEDQLNRDPNQSYMGEFPQFPK